jgi:hypothetical protein
MEIYQNDIHAERPSENHFHPHDEYAHTFMD